MENLFRTQTYHLNGIQLQVTEAGDALAPVILFLHGFPEFSFAWHQQLPFFAQAGYRAVAPDQRGYNNSSKPAGVGAYRLKYLVADMVALIKELTPEKIFLVGHDWGAAVAWNLAAQFPELLHQLIILNMPHPRVLYYNLRHNLRQMRKSWYAGVFQIPWLPEKLSSALDYKILVNSLVKTALPGTFTETDLNQYKLAWSQPGALTAMLNWYRAYNYLALPQLNNITVPTLVIWGNQDTFLSAEMAAPSISHCEKGHVIFLPDATHWLHHEEPEKVNRLILDFIRPKTYQQKREKQ